MIWPTWFSKKIRQACQGGLGCRIMYLSTVGFGRVAVQQEQF